MSSTKKLPVTRHRLFPVITGLWLAALLGLGSFAVPPSVLERAVAATGLPALLPAAAPPLGFTARAAIALVLTGLGAVIGFAAGRRLGRTEQAPVRRRRSVGPDAASVGAPRIRARDSHPDAAPRKPFTASEDIVAETASPAESEAAAPPLRRRLLALTDESRPADPREHAPLPGSASFEPIDLDRLFVAGSEATRRDVPPIHYEVIAPEPVPPVHYDEIAVRDAALSVAGAAPAVVEALPESNAGDDAEESDDCAFAEVEAEAEAQSQTEQPAVLFEAEEAEPAPVVSEEPAVSAPQCFIAPAAPVIHSPLANAPVESLGLVQLVERLALAIANYEARRPGGELPNLLAPALADLAAATSAAAASAESDPAIELPAPAAPAAVSAAPVTMARLPSTPPIILHAPVASPVPYLALHHDPVQPEDEAGDADGEELPQTSRFLTLDEPVDEPASEPLSEPVAELADAEDEEDELLLPAECAIGPDRDFDDVPADAEDEILANEEQEGVRASAYPSLLDMPALPKSAPFAEPPALRTTPPAARQMFIRVEEPEEPVRTVEPVVIFPGHAARASAADPAEQAAAPADHTESPAQANQAADREEADRALRAALATLQRMTGAR